MALLPVTLGKVVVATAGTAVPLADSALPAYAVIVQALKANTGTVYVGDSSVDESSAVGHALAAGESFVINGINLPRGLEEMMLNDFYVDAANNNDGVHVTYLTRRP